MKTKKKFETEKNEINDSQCFDQNFKVFKNLIIQDKLQLYRHMYSINSKISREKKNMKVKSP